MTIKIQDPALQVLIEEDVRNGRFRNAEHLIEIALQHFYAEADDEDFDDATAAEIAAACGRAARGERGIPIDEVYRRLLDKSTPPVRS